MVAIDSLRALAVTIFGLAAVSSALAQTAADSSSTDPEVQTAIYHAAGNSTQVPTDIVVTQPTDSSVWYTQDKVSISWTGTKPIDFAFQIINKDKTVRASGLTLVAEAKTMTGTAKSKIGKIEPGTYFVRLYDPTDISKQIALSRTFTIKDKSEKPMTAEGGAVSANGTMTSTTGTQTGSLTSSADATQGGVTATNTAANQVSSGKSSTSAAKDAAAGLTTSTITVAGFLSFAISAIVLQ